MSTHIFRVVVRGHFHGLRPELRARLLAEADDHEIFKAAYTADGTLTYEPNLVSFSFRYELRNQADATADAEDQVIEEAMAKAAASLDAIGAGQRHLRATATNMASVWSQPGDQAPRGAQSR